MATMYELAQTIATAATGKDVREAMAEAVRQFDTVKGAVYQRMKEISDENEQISNRLDSLETTHTSDVTALYKAIQQARDDLTRAFSDADKALGDQLGKRIDELSAAITNYEKVTDERLKKIEKTLYGTVYINGSPNDKEGSSQPDGVVINQTPDDNLTQFIKLN